MGIEAESRRREYPVGTVFYLTPGTLCRNVNGDTAVLVDYAKVEVSSIGEAGGGVARCMWLRGPWYWVDDQVRFKLLRATSGLMADTDGLPATTMRPSDGEFSIMEGVGVLKF